jgi:hypothetical protein
MSDSESLARALAESRARELGFGVPGADPLASAPSQSDDDDDLDDDEVEAVESEDSHAIPAADDDDEPRRDPHTLTCGTCNGYGQTLTGSRVQAFSTRTCPDCQGMGYVELLREPEPEPQPAAPEAGPAPWPEPPPPASPYVPMQSWG